MHIFIYINDRFRAFFTLLGDTFGLVIADSELPNSRLFTTFALWNWN